MKTNTRTAVLAGCGLAGVACVLALILFSVHTSPKRLQLVPTKPVSEQAVPSADAEIGTGWSTAADPREAVAQALTMALEGKKHRNPDFVVLFATSGSDMNTVLASAREILGKDAKIYGGTSDSRGVMTDKGFVAAARKGYGYTKTGGNRALAVMTVTSKSIVFGIGSANCPDYFSVQECAGAAVKRALRSAGKSQDQSPDLVLLTAPRSLEEECLEGIQSIVGIRTPVIGGTAGGPVFGSLGETEVYGKGVSLAVIYTELPVGWVFEGGFDVADEHSGMVTRVDAQAILEIDHRPALEVYDEWLGGHIGRLFNETRDYSQVRTLLTLHPLYRKYTSPDGETYFLFSHPWPKEMTLTDKAVMTSTKIKEGERIHLSHGSWETFLNRIGKLPRTAKMRGGISHSAKPLFGIGYICAGVMGVIPPSERQKMPHLINNLNNGAPFIGTFTWGEQGYFPGIGNKHGNLLTSFVVVGHRE